MQVQLIIQKLIFIFILILQGQSQSTCNNGCVSCDESFSVCYECDTGFSLDLLTKQCISSQCQEGLFLQIHEKDQLRECVAVCDNNYYQNELQNTCSKLQQCSLSFSTNSNVNRGDSVRDILSFNQQNRNFLLIQYSNYFVMVKRQNGEYQQNLDFPSDIIQIQKFGENLIFLVQNRTIYNWDFLKNTYQQITQIVYSQVEVKQVQLIQINNSVCYYLIDQDRNVVIFGSLFIVSTLELVQNQQYLEISYDTIDSIQYSGVFLFLNNNNSLKVFEIQQPNSFQMQYKQYNTQNTCPNLQNRQVISILRGINSQNILIIFNQVSSLILMNEQTCVLKPTIQPPVYSIYIAYNNQDYYIIQFSASIQVLDYQLQVIDQIDFIPLNVIDITGYVFNNSTKDQSTIFVLLSDFTINQYDSYQDSQQTKFFNQTQKVNVLVTNPQSLFIIDQVYNSQTNQLLFQKRLFVVNEDVQSLVIQTSNNPQQIPEEKVEYTISNFELKQKTYKKIANLLPLENLMLLMACSRDGQLLAWDISNVFEDQYLYGVQLTADSCLELIPFNSTNPSDIIAVFSKQIFLLDVLSLNVKKTWQQGNQKMKYSVKDNNVAILIDSNLIFFKKDLSNQQQLSFTGPISDIQNIFFEQGSYLVVQKSSTIEIYSIQPSIKILKSYTVSNKILLMKIRNFPSDYQIQNNIMFEISLYSQDQTFLLMKEDLIPYQTIKSIPFSNITDIQFIKSDPQDQIYFIIGKTNKTISSTPYTLYFIQRGIQQINYIIDYSYASQFIEPTKYYDSYNNPIYDIKVLSNKGSMSTLLSNSYDPTRNIVQFDQTQQIFGQTGIRLYLSQNKKILFGRNYIGTIYVGNFKITQYKELYKVSQQEELSGKKIQDIQFSYRMGKFFIITNTIQVLNIHNYELIEEIVFSFSQNESILQFEIIEDKSIIVARKQNILLIKNFSTNKTFYFQSNHTFTQFYSYSFNQTYQILIAGEQIMKLNLNLEVITSLQYPINTLDIQQIIFTNKIIICKFSKSQILIINNDNFTIIKEFQPKIITQADFSIQYDTTFDRIYLYNNIIQVYNYLGQFYLSSTPLKDPIIDIQIYGKYTLFLSSQQIAITESISLKVLDIYSFPGDGHVQKILYIKDFNHLAISGNTIKEGSIFIYSLDQLQQIQVISNQYSLNQPYNVVDMLFDSYSNIFTLLDQNGNILSVDYSGAYQIVNIMKIKEFQIDSNIPLAMKICTQRNEIYVFSQKYLQLVYYGGFTEYQVQYSINSNNIFTSSVIQLNNQTNKQADIFIILGQQNILFQYSNYNFNYLYYLAQTDKIKDISFLSTNQLLLVLSKEYLILRVNLDVDNLSNSIQDYQDFNLGTLEFSYFLCKSVFYSMNHTIVQYDFANQKILFQIFLEQNQIVINSLLIDSMNILVIGLNDGTVIFFDLTNKNYSKQMLISSSQQDYVRYITQTKDTIWIATTSSLVLQINKSNLDQVQQHDFSSLSQIPGSKLFNFEIDDEYQRMFLHFQGKKLIFCLDIKQFPNQSIVYSSFSNNQQNRILIANNQIIFYSTSQLNIHDRKSLQYLTSIRRQGLYDSIQMIQVFLGKFYFILSQGKFEIILVDYVNNQQKLVDQVQVQQLIIMKLVLESNDTVLRVIGTSRYQIFDQKYSLNLSLNQNNQFAVQKCGLDLNDLKFLEMTLAVKLIKPNFLQLPSLLGIVEIPTSSQNRQLNYYLDKQDLSEINLGITKQSDLVISPYLGDQQNSQQKSQNFPIATLSSYSKSKLLMKDFNFIFKQSQFIIPMNSNIKTTYLQNISVSNQTLNDIQIYFQDQDKIVIKNLRIENVVVNYNNPSNSLFLFSNCSTIYIEQLYIKNLTFNEKSSFLINFDQVNQLTINDFKLEDCQFNSMIQIINSQILKMDTLLVQNSKSFTSNPILQMVPVAVFQIRTVKEQQISNVFMNNNIDVRFIESLNSIQFSDQFIQLNTVQFSLTNSVFQLNNISQYQNISLVNAIATDIFLENIQFNDNQGNILLQQSEKINLLNSTFTRNQNLNGGALYIKQNSQFINFTECTFNDNIAFANGGAIFFEDIQADLSFDQKSIIKNNIALIGGGVRIYNTKQGNHLSELSQIIQNAQIVNNKASLYGQNIATILSQLVVKPIFEINNEKNPINYQFLVENQLSQEEQLKYSGKLLIFDLNSGSQLQLSFQLLDENDDILFFDVNKIKNNDYNQIILDEIKEISFKLENYDSSQILLNGDTQLDFSNFNMNSQQFDFNRLQMVAFPNSTSHLQLQYTTFQSYVNKPIFIQIYFRNCNKGEILQQYNENIYRCYECPKGYYSLKNHEIIKRNQTKLISEILIENKCLSCPDVAEYCQGSTLQLKQGYWRSKIETDDILYCYNKPQNCMYNPFTKQNCVEGKIGPLCEECDSFGEQWKGYRYTLSYTNDFECTKCQYLYIPAILLFLLTFFLFIYCVISMIMFLNSFSHYQICYYLRKLQIMPISKSCFQDYSSFYLKILLNYMQITSYIIETRKLFPNNINASLFLIQSPSFYFISIVDCLTNRLVHNRISRIHLIQLLMALFPFFCIIVITCIVKILYRLKLIQVNRSYQRTLLNLMIILFQPSQITFFTNAMSCSKIGQNQYNKLDLLITCNDSNYLKFSLPFSISILGFWISIPLLIFFQLKKQKHKLNFCKIKFQYGYFYSEYNERYYYWEFIRIYIRIAIVMIFTLINFLSFVNLIVIFLLLLYIKLILKVKPIVNKDLQKVDIISVIVIIICILLTRINQQYGFYSLSILSYLIFLIFTVACIYMIVSEKLHSELNIFGRFLRWIIFKTCSQSVYEAFIKKNKVQFSTYMRWRVLKFKIHTNFIQKRDTIKQKLQINTNSKLESRYDCNSKTYSPDSLLPSMKIDVNQLRIQNNNKQKSIFQKDMLDPIQETIDSTDGEVKDENCISQTPYIASMLMFSDKRMIKENGKQNSDNLSLDYNNSYQVSFFQSSFNKSSNNQLFSNR